MGPCKAKIEKKKRKKNNFQFLFNPTLPTSSDYRRRAPLDLIIIVRAASESAKTINSKSNNPIMIRMKSVFQNINIIKRWHARLSQYAQYAAAILYGPSSFNLCIKFST